MANGTIYVRADGSIDPPTAAISTAGNITYVFTGDFNDSIVIERDNILVDGAGFKVQGNGTGKGISLTQRTNVTIKNTTIKDFAYGIWLNQSANNRILENDIASNTTQMNNYGVRLEFSTDNVISGNNITGNRFSLALTSHSSNNIIAGNNVRSSIYGIALEDSQNNTIAGNRIAHNMFGTFLFSSADNNQVCEGNVIAGNSQSGIQIVSSTGNLVHKNNLTANSEDGVFLDSSTGNSVVENYIRGNKYGVRAYSSLGNFVFHNSLVANMQQVQVVNSSFNQWDDGSISGGNYWSDHLGADTNHDGISEFPYTIDAVNVDNYPLKGMFLTFNTSRNQPTIVVSNSTIKQFRYDETNRTITMTVSNSSSTQSFGFCRMCIPKNLIPPPYTVVIDGGSTAVTDFNGELHDNSTHRWIYFAYQHSIHEVVIIPEFLYALLLPLCMIATLLTVKVRKRRACVIAQLEQ